VKLQAGVEMMYGSVYVPLPVPARGMVEESQREGEMPRDV